jgi:hypothetical protein
VARDFVEILKRVEALYPAAIGGATHDESLRQMLVPWANDVILELGQMQRWSYEYTTVQQITTQGVQTYSLPTGMMVIKRIFYVDQTGMPVQLDKRERYEAARILGDGEGSNLPVQGTPRMYSLDNRTLTLFPIPDNAGPDFTAYNLYIQGYSLMQPIVETTGNTVSTTSALVVPDALYVNDRLGATGGAAVSIRGAGAIQFAGTNDTMTGSYAWGGGNNYAVGATATQTVSNAQTYFNSQPWVVTYWPKVVLFAMLRELSAYESSAQVYQMWEQRYQNELTLLRAYEFDRSRTIDMKAAAHVGQEMAEERRIDNPVGMDIRGIL